MHWDREKRDRVVVFGPHNRGRTPHEAASVCVVWCSAAPAATVEPAAREVTSGQLFVLFAGSPLLTAKKLVEIRNVTERRLDDSEEALAQLLAACGGSYEFRGEIVVYIFPSNVKSKLGARRANARLQRGLAAAATAAQYAVGAFVLLATLFVAVVVVLFCAQINQ